MPIYEAKIIILDTISVGSKAEAKEAFEEWIEEIKEQHSPAHIELHSVREE
jgi:hypothetical protein